MPALADPASLDRMFSALADVHRRDMLDRLSRGPATVSELAEPLGIALPSAVKHLAVLEQGGFVASRKLGRVRTYTAEPRAMDAMATWVARRKTLLDQQFDPLETGLAAPEGKAPR
jgi:DNA-binding transcriptional ArsR family regulator